MSFFYALIAGWLGGWLVNYLADVLPVFRRFSHPVCPKCNKPFTWADYLLLKNCGSCGKRRSTRTIVVMAAMVVAAILLWIFPRLMGFPLSFILIVYLTIVLVIDLEHRLILHPVSLVGAILAFGIGIYLHSLEDTLLGGAFGFGVMLLFYFIGIWYVRIMAKRKGIASDEVALGFGDVNFSGILGLLLGWPSILIGLFLGVIVGGIVSLLIIITMMARKQYRAFTAIPYAPFLVLSALMIFIR